MPNENHTLLIEFEHGNKVLFNMQRQVKIIPYAKLKNIDYFKAVKFDDKSIYWDEGEMQSIIPLRFSLDSILFSIRDSK